MRNRAFLVAPFLGLVVLLCSRPGRTQNGDQAAADQLFREGRQLMDEKKYPEACARFEASQQMGPAIGTLLNLAVCHEAEGRIATAWGEFAQVLAAARREGHKEREEFARTHQKNLEPRLPRLTVLVPPKVRKSGLAIKRNNQELAEGAWSIALPIDPGTVQIEASAPGFTSWSTELKIKEKEAKEIEVPELQPVPAPPPSASAPPSSSPGPLLAPPTSAEPPPPTLPQGWSTRKTTGAILGGVGLVGVGVGAYFGLKAFSNRSDSDARCPSVGGVEYCDRQGVQLNNDARTAARVSNIGLGLGLLTLGAGAYLFLSDRGASSARTGVSLRGVGLALGDRNAGAVISGGF